MRRSLSYVLFAAGALTATVALAQVKKGGGPRGTRRPTGASKDAGAGDSGPYDKGDLGKAVPTTSDGGSPPAETVASAAVGADAAEPPGESPAAQSQSQAAADESVRSSPLNPRPEEFPDGGAVMTSAELDKIIGEIAALRARVAVVSDTLFHSRVVLRVETRGDHARIAKLVVTLDEGIVYTPRPLVSAPKTRPRSTTMPLLRDGTCSAFRSSVVTIGATATATPSNPGLRWMCRRTSASKRSSGSTTIPTWRPIFRRARRALTIFGCACAPR